MNEVVETMRGVAEMEEGSGVIFCTKSVLDALSWDSTDGFGGSECQSPSEEPGVPG